MPPKSEKPKIRIGKLLPQEEKPAKPERYNIFDEYNQDTEILDLYEGWVYERLKEPDPKYAILNNLVKTGVFSQEYLQEYSQQYKEVENRGRKLRRIKESLSNYQDEPWLYWRTKIFDLAYCEQSRWHAVQYADKQYAKINGVFDLVANNTPFSCVKIVSDYPGYKWIEFPKNRDRGVSYDWWEHSWRNKQKTDTPDAPLKQEVGDAWFNYQDRCKTIRRITSPLHRLFEKALELRYSEEFYRYKNNYKEFKKKLVINGREYIIGQTEKGFGVIVYPENLITEIIE